MAPRMSIVKSFLCLYLGPGTSSGSKSAEEIGPPVGFLGRSQLSHYDDSSSDSDSEEKYFDRDSLLREINADIKNIISNTERDNESKVKVKKEEDIIQKAEAVASNYRGKDGALYTLEIFMRDKNTCRRKNDRPGKGDQRAPIIYDKSGVANAIIPANHKLMLLCTRIATNPRHYIPRGNYVLFKFFVDGEALSEGTLHEASISKPDINFAKAFIDTHEVKDNQRVECASEANSHVGTFVVKVFTKLRETLVSEQYSALPEDDRVLEKTKRRICCSVNSEDNIDVVGNGNQTNRQVKRFEEPQAGLKECGLPAATIQVRMKHRFVN